ncbi:MAG: hypothetical protein V3T20_02860, partial [Gemmatimonadota bacterium]
VRTQLEARGLPPDLVEEVSTIAADVTAQGLPPDMLVDKAVEGWAKHVPQARIVAVIRQQSQQLVRARDALRVQGWDAPPGPMITASAEAMGRGISAQQVGAVVEAAPTPEAAGPGLRVAAALSAQGLGNEQAVQVVTRAMRRGETPEEILNMPSFARAMQAQGMGAAQIGERLMQGGGAMRGAGTGPGMGTRPPGVPPEPGGGKRIRRP